MGSVLIRDQRAARAFPFRSPNISSYVRMRLFLEERKVMSKDKVKETAASLKRQREEQDRLNAPYERALGKLSIRFSLLHSLLEGFCWEVWGMNPHVAAIITKDLPTKVVSTGTHSLFSCTTYISSMV